MSKKPRTSRHRVHVPGVMKSDPIDERYQVEIDMSTQRLERRYRKAQKALEAAERRAAGAAALLERTQDRKARIRHADLLAVVEERRRELQEIERLMMPSDHSSRDARRRQVRHEAAAITVPLGATTGKPLKREQPPTFPVQRRTA